MREAKVVLFLRAIAVFAFTTFLVGGVFGRGTLSRSPSSVADLVLMLRQGFGDGFMGLVVMAFLVGLPIAMLVVAWEGRRTRPRHLWIALATSGVLVVSAMISALAG